MKHTANPRQTYDPAQHPQPPEPSRNEISAMADRVMAGGVVVAPFDNGVFVLVMIELGMRGWFRVERSEREKLAEPFTIKVSERRE